MGSRLRGGDGNALCGFRNLTLLDPIFVATGVLGEASVPLVNDRACHHIVEEGAVVGDKEEGSLVVHEQFLEQFKCLGIEVVGWLVEYQDIGWLEEEASQQKSVTFAAREHFGWHTNPVGREEKVAKIAVDMAWPTLESHGFGFTGDIPGHALFAIDLVA